MSDNEVTVVTGGAGGLPIPVCKAPVTDHITALIAKD